MSSSKAMDSTQGEASSVGPYTVYAAGGLFTQDELAMNVMLKEAVWRLSNGRFQLFLPQSRELREFDRPDIEAYIRNDDLVEVVKADIVTVRFDGLELDSGTVVEFITAKSLGKPTVILRCDFRRLSGTGLAEPYNLMVKSWPRNVVVHTDALMMYSRLLAQEREALGKGDAFQATMKAELGAILKCIDQLAQQMIDGMEAAIAMPSPYPPEYQEMVYRAFRYCPGGGFDHMLTEEELAETIQKLRKSGTL